MSKDRFNILAMIKTSVNISTNSNPGNNRSSPVIIGSIPKSNEFTFHLHEGGPDIIGKLNLYDRFKSSQSHSNSNAHNTCFSQRRIEDSLITIFSRKTFSSGKYSPLTVGYILTKNKHFLISFEFLIKGMVNSIDHNYFRTSRGCFFIFKSIPESAFVKYIFIGSFRFRIWCKYCFIGCRIDLFSYFLFKVFKFLL